MKIIVSPHHLSILFCFAIYLLCPVISNAQEPEQKEPEQKEGEKVVNDQVKNIHAFDALPQEVRKEYLELKMSALKDFRKKKYSTCFVKTIQAEELFKLDYETYFWRGMCYAEWHDMKNAIIEYEKALAIDPSVSVVSANLFEICYFSEEYGRCLEMWDRMERVYNKKGLLEGQKPLLEFKILISMTKLLGERPKLKGEITKLSKAYGFMDDTPYYYFSQALPYYQAGEKVKGDERIRAAIYVFGLHRLAHWNKALNDAGYIDDHTFQKYMSAVFGRRK